MSEIKKELVLIPKSEKYIQYMLEVIMKLPLMTLIKQKCVRAILFSEIMSLERQWD